MNDNVMQKMKITGWMSAAAGFLFLALSNLGWHWTQVLVTFSFLIAGVALFRSERAKSALVFAWGGLCFCSLWAENISSKFLILGVQVWFYLGAIFYFKATRFKGAVIKNVVILVVLSLLSLVFHIGFIGVLIIALVMIFQLFFVACFISRKYLPLEEIILNVDDKYLGGKVIRKIGRFMSAQCQECGPLQKFCLFYAYSIVVVGLISSCFFILLASPTKNVKVWDHDMLVMAVTQFVGCVICVCFVLSQISCAIKLRGRQIVAGSAPWYLWFVSVLCWLASVVALVGIVFFCTSDSSSSKQSDWVISWTLSLVDVPTLLRVAARWSDLLKAAVIFPAVVTIWHLIGCGFVALLIRDNVAKVLSLENVNDHKTEGREAMKEADAAAQQQA